MNQIHIAKAKEDCTILKGIMEIDDAIADFTVLKEDPRFPSEQVDKEIAYLKEVQNYLFSQLNGLSY